MAPIRRSALYSTERQVAEEAVLHASILTKQVQATVSHIFKDDKSPVTIADFAAQAIIIGALHCTFPDDAFLGEEDSEALRADARLCDEVWKLVHAVTTSARLQSMKTKMPVPVSVEEMLHWIDLGGRGHGGDTGRIWIMDPVDGTATFLKGQQYAVSLSLIDNGKEVLGVLGCPNVSSDMVRISEDNVNTNGFGIMLTAVRNQGATIRKMTLNGLDKPQSLTSNNVRKPDGLHIVDCLACPVTRHDATAKLATSLNARYPETELRSSHMRYAAMIIGGANAAFWIPASPASKLHIWDHAGSQLIFSEMGGKVTDLDGKVLDFGAGRDLSRNRGLVVARGDIHQDLLVAMRSMLTG